MYDYVHSAGMGRGSLVLNRSLLHKVLRSKFGSWSQHGSLNMGLVLTVSAGVVPEQEDER